MPRSGSTLIEQILASHPRVHGAGERQDFRDAIIAVDKAQCENYPDRVSSLTAEQLRAIASHYLATMGAARATPTASSTRCSATSSMSA